MNKIALLSTVLGLVGALGACGDGDDPATASSGGSSSSGASSSGSSSGGSSSGADSGAVDAGPKVVVQSEPLNVTVQILPSSATLNGKIFTPATCQKAAPCPLVVVVADRDMTGYPTLEEPAEKLAARAEMVVVVFNLPGKGTGGFQSGGEDDIGGNNHVTAVKEVMKLISTRPQVDATRVGFLTIGYGLVPVAHALRLHGSNTLKKVLFLVDVEGPTDRCAISEAPANKDAGIGPDDGPGATASACHFDADSPHGAVYPAAKDGNPASIVCSPAAWPITKTGKDCKSDWWPGREPYNELKSVAVRYQRIQFKHDHRLPSHFASRHAMKAIASSSSPWFTLNDLQPCSAIPAEDVLKNAAGAYLEGPWGNGLAPAPYAGDDRKVISLGSLFGEVLPGRIKRIVAPESAKCK